MHEVHVQYDPELQFARPCHGPRPITCALVGICLFTLFQNDICFVTCFRVLYVVLTLSGQFEKCICFWSNEYLDCLQNSMEPKALVRFRCSIIVYIEFLKDS